MSRTEFLLSFTWKATLKEIKNFINNQTFMIEDPNHDEPVTPCMDVCKAKIQYDGSVEKIEVKDCSQRGSAK